MRVVVKPAPDGHDMRSNWVVEAGHETTTHVKKSAAKRTARDKASVGDTLEIRRTDGTIQRTTTVEDSSNTDDESSGFAPPGLGTFKTGVTDAFDK